MTNKKSTKKALLMSALSLLLCMSMLVGTTFAWFTDSVSTTNNIITAGNLDVNLYWSTNGADWTPVDADTNVFKTGTLWEPGHTEVVYLKVVNEGTLALKYNLDVIVASEVPGTNVANDPFKLSDYILYNVYEEIKTYADSAAARGDETGKQLNVAYNKATTLKAGEETVLTLVAFMPTTVGNEANYLKDTAVPTINLGINLFATQETYEKDSYGDQYDANATLCNFVVANEAELIAALAEAKTGDVIGINGDNVTWATGASHGSTPFVTDANYITLIGLSEDATFTATGSGVGPVGIDNGTVVFKNLKIADKSVSYNEGAWELGYLEFRGNTVFENCEIVNAIQMEGENASFENCSFNSGKDNEYAVWVCSGDATFEDCTFNGARGIKIHEAYGSEIGKVVINNNTFIELSKKPGLAIGDLNADTAVVLTNNMFIGTQAGDQGKYSYESDTDVTSFSFTDKDNKVVTNGSNGLYKDEADVYYATSNEGLTQAAQNGVKDLFLATDIEIAKNTETLLHAPAGSVMNVDGNGTTITTNGTGTAAGSSYDYGYVGFIPANGKDATVSDLKVVGSGFVEVGHHGESTKGNYTINKLVIEDLVATLNINNGGNNIAAAFSHYGNATMTDCVMTGTTTLKDGFKPYDAAFVNGTKTVISGGEYGTIYLANQAHVTITNAEIDVIDSCAITTRNLGKLTIGAGAKIGTINLTPGTYKPALVIEDGAEIGAIVYNGVTYTVAEWNAR